MCLTIGVVSMIKVASVRAVGSDESVVIRPYLTYLPDPNKHPSFLTIVFLRTNDAGNLAATPVHSVSFSTEDTPNPSGITFAPASDTGTVAITLPTFQSRMGSYELIQGVRYWISINREANLRGWFTVPFSKPGDREVVYVVVSDPANRPYWVARDSSRRVQDNALAHPLTHPKWAAYSLCAVAGLGGLYVFDWARRRSRWRMEGR